MRLAWIVFAALSACLASADIAQGVWTLENVADGRVGSIAIAPDGSTHVTYSTTFDGVWYARKNGGAWDHRQVAAAGGVERSGLRLDPDGDPHVLYSTYLANGLPVGLHYTDWRGFGFAEPHDDVHVSPPYGISPTLALSSGGEPRISYQDYAEEDIWYSTGTWTGTGWNWTELNVTPEAIHPGGHGAYSPIALELDSNDDPAIAYRYADQVGDEKLGFARYDPDDPQADGNGWVLEIADGHPTSGQSVSLAFDSADQPRVVHVDSQDRELRYVTWTQGSGWVSQVLDALGAADTACMVLDSEDHEHIVYGTGGAIKYAAWTGSQWNVSTVAPGSNPRLALDAQDNPRIIFEQWDGSNTSVVYAIPEPAALSILVLGTLAVTRRKHQAVR